VQVKGLETIPADRGAFLVQTTTLLVPLLQALTQGGLATVPARTWGACLLAFCGVLLMGSTASDGSLSLSFAIGNGDLLVLGAALLYSVHVLRLSALAPGVEALRLALAKAFSEGALALGSIAFLLLLTPSLPPAREVVRFAEAFLTLDAPAQLMLAGAAAWCGAVTCGYTIWAQSYGQAGGISATNANLVYTSQPLWSSLFAWLLLGELLTPAEAAGGLAIAAAVWTATTVEADLPDDAER
jgi:drug/metabolite transporter (DMT)-like permease